MLICLYGAAAGSNLSGLSKRLFSLLDTIKPGRIILNTGEYSSIRSSLMQEVYKHKGTHLSWRSNYHCGRTLTAQWRRRRVRQRIQFLIDQKLNST